jgi:hypothetical protein
MGRTLFKKKYGTFSGYIGESQDHSVTDKVSPHFGYKIAALYYNDKNNSVELVAPHHSINTPLSSDSFCKRNHDSIVRCSCGFYAYAEVSQAITHADLLRNSFSNLCVIKVALSGTVVVAEKGFRASHQRVTKIALPACWKCDIPGERLLIHETHFLIPSCKEHAKGMKGYDFDELALFHSPTGFKPIALASFSDLSRQAPTFLDPETIVSGITRTAIDLIMMNREDLLLNALDEIDSFKEEENLKKNSEDDDDLDRI